MEELKWKVGDEVWLDVKNLKTQYPSAKLAPKQEGPFKIIGKIGSSSFALELPEQWKIHNVFHASLLKPYIKNEEHGPNWTKPPANLINDKEEYKIDQIMKCRCVKKKWEYYVSWKGYPTTENMWIPLEDFKHARETSVKWHRKHPKKPRPPGIKLKWMTIKARRILETLADYGIKIKEQAKLAPMDHKEELESGHTRLILTESQSAKVHTKAPYKYKSNQDN